MLFLDEVIRSTENVSNFLKDTQLVNDESGLTPVSLATEFIVLLSYAPSL